MINQPQPGLLAFRIVTALGPNRRGFIGASLHRFLGALRSGLVQSVGNADPICSDPVLEGHPVHVADHRGEERREHRKGLRRDADQCLSHRRRLLGTGRAVVRSRARLHSRHDGGTSQRGLERVS